MLLRDEYERQSAELYHTRRGQAGRITLELQTSINIYNFFADGGGPNPCKIFTSVTFLFNNLLANQASSTARSCLHLNCVVCLFIGEDRLDDEGAGWGK